MYQCASTRRTPGSAHSTDGVDSARSRRAPSAASRTVVGIAVRAAGAVDRITGAGGTGAGLTDAVRAGGGDTGPGSTGAAVVGGGDTGAGSTGAGVAEDVTGVGASSAVGGRRRGTAPSTSAVA